MFLVVGFASLDIAKAAKLTHKAVRVRSKALIIERVL
jgi:hypothetical protein